jgi:NTE family protein
MKIGLALSGGGARGFAHLGVLKALEANSIPIDFVSGTSAGSFVGAAYASGLTIEEIIEVANKISWFNMAGLSYSPRALFSNASMGNFIGRHFRVGKIEELSIPFAAVACDLNTGEEIVLRDSGDLASAIRASCAIPGVFAPLSDPEGRLLVDGGVVAPGPVSAVRSLGAEAVIAIDLMACGATFHGTPRTMVGMMFQSAMLLLRSASRLQHVDADVIITPQIAHIRPDEIAKRDELIKLGEKAALEKMEEIVKLISKTTE